MSALGGWCQQLGLRRTDGVKRAKSGPPSVQQQATELKAKLVADPSPANIVTSLLDTEPPVWQAASQANPRFCIPGDTSLAYTVLDIVAGIEVVSAAAAAALLAEDEALQAQEHVCMAGLTSFSETKGDRIPVHPSPAAQGTSIYDFAFLTLPGAPARDMVLQTTCGTKIEAHSIVMGAASEHFRTGTFTTDEVQVSDASPVVLRVVVNEYCYLGRVALSSLEDVSEVTGVAELANRWLLGPLQHTCALHLEQIAGTIGRKRARDSCKKMGELLGKGGSGAGGSHDSSRSGGGSSSSGGSGGSGGTGTSTSSKAATATSAAASQGQVVDDAAQFMLRLETLANGATSRPARALLLRALGRLHIMVGSIHSCFDNKLAHEGIRIYIKDICPVPAIPT